MKKMNINIVKKIYGINIFRVIIQVVLAIILWIIFIPLVIIGILGGLLSKGACIVNDLTLEYTEKLLEYLSDNRNTGYNNKSKNT